MKYTFLSILLLLLTSCSTIHKIDHYQISLHENNPDQKKYEHGLVFVNDPICLWAIEGYSKDAVVASFGPEFLPAIPLGNQVSKTQPGYFQLNVWIVPDRTTYGLSFDPRELKLKLSSGKEVAPVRAEFWRKHTTFRKTPSLVLPQNEEEIVTPGGDIITLVRPMKPIKLSSYVISWIDFKYPQEETPVGIIFDGFTNSDSKPIKPVAADLKKSVDLEYRGVANLFVGDLTPLEACRELMKE